MGLVFADLHTHSSASDGILTPEQVVKAAKEAGLSALALTDHDTIGGLSQASIAALSEKIRFVPGIELSCSFPEEDVSIHLLGLFVDPSSKTLQELLTTQRNGRYRRALKILDLLENLGIDISALRKVFLAEKEKPLGRPHVARFLLETGVIKTFQEAFDRFLRRGAPAYVPKDVLLPEEGIKAIKAAGGLAFIAHPCLIQEWDLVWEKIRALPIDGLEVYYWERNANQEERFKNIARENGLLICGGSDFHGVSGTSDRKLGSAGLNEEDFFTLVEFAKSRNDRSGGKDRS